MDWWVMEDGDGRMTIDWPALTTEWPPPPPISRSRQQCGWKTTDTGLLSAIDNDVMADACYAHA